MALQICTESFVGELEGGISLSAQKGVTILDDSKPAEAKMLKAWGTFFAPVASTHSYSEVDLAEAKAVKQAKSSAKGQRTKAKNAEAKDAEPTPEPEPEIPVGEHTSAAGEFIGGGLSNARLREASEDA